MHKQCVPGAPSDFLAPGNEAMCYQTRSQEHKSRERARVLRDTMHVKIERF